jgi:2-methylcitrate dehydratase PrpD
MDTAAHGSNSLSRTIAAYATSLKYEDIPAEVIARAKACMLDTIAVSSFGASMPWCKIINEYALRNGAAGKASVLGTKLKLAAPYAALANGAAGHAFEMDSLVQPGVGAHIGTALLAPGLAIAQEVGASGRDLLTAFVAGSEIIYRVGDSSRHSPEKVGFHAPGLTGVFGGAITAGLLMKLDTARMAQSLGIGGSLCSGLLEFSKSGGGMVKRMHLGRAAEGAVMAASFARDGFTGPSEVFEGKFGFFKVFCDEIDAPRLTAGFGSTWHTMKIMMKRYSCHITAHVPVTAVLELKQAHGIKGGDIESITVASSEKMVSHHNITEPQDITMAQYSTPFCVALAFYRDPRDPTQFSDASIADPEIRALCRKVKLQADNELTRDNQFATRMTVTLKNGKVIEHITEVFPGMPRRPLTDAELREKFDRIVTGIPAATAARLFEQFSALETVKDVAALKFD